MRDPRRACSTIRGARGAAFLAFCIVASAGALVASSAHALPVRPVEEPAPPILDAIPEDPGLNNVTLTADGSRAAASVVEQLQERKFRSSVRFYLPNVEESVQTTLSGEVRDLLYAPGGESLFALLHLPAKKRPGDVDLLQIDSSTGKTQRRLRMPPSAVGLAYWPGEDAILVVCAHEIRSVLLPKLRSGPLYRLIGVNTSAAILGGSLLLVGREDGLSLIDLRDPPGEQQMPVRLHIESNDTPVQVATNRDGSTTRIRYLNGGIASVDLSAAALVPETGDGVLPLRPWPARDAVPGIPAKLAAEAVAARPADERMETPPPPATPDPGAPPSDAAVAEALVATTPSEAATAPPARPEPEADAMETLPDTKQPEVVTAQPLVPEPEAGATAAPGSTSRQDADARDDPSVQIRGRLSGPGVDTVRAVVLLGPDSILSEATRVTPDSDGFWNVSGLEPGRYRIQLTGGTDHVPISDPPFRVVEIQTDQPTVEASFQVLAAR